MVCHNGMRLSSSTNVEYLPSAETETSSSLYSDILGFVLTLLVMVWGMIIVFFCATVLIQRW